HLPMHIDVPRVKISAVRVALPLFPTRRSSDLDFSAGSGHRTRRYQLDRGSHRRQQRRLARGQLEQTGEARGFHPSLHAVELRLRSEEHTSELQSRENLVCRLLLEKMKNKISRR